MIGRFTPPERKSAQVPAVFVGTWEHSVFNDALYQMGLNLCKIEYLAAKLFEPMTSSQAEGVRGEISGLKADGLKLIKSICKDPAQGAIFLQLVLATYGGARYLTQEQQVALTVTGMGMEIAKL